MLDQRVAAEFSPAGLRGRGEFFEAFQDVVHEIDVEVLHGAILSDVERATHLRRSAGRHSRATIAPKIKL